MAYDELWRAREARATEARKRKAELAAEQAARRPMTPEPATLKAGEGVENKAAERETDLIPA